MNGDLQQAILAARKPVVGASTGGHVGFRAKEPSIALASESIALGGYSPFGYLGGSHNQPSPSSKGGGNVGHRWADSILRNEGRRVRVLLAVRDAARMAQKNGINPGEDPIYVGGAIRSGWNLSSDQLSKGLKQLEQFGEIRVVERKKGRHTRFLLNFFEEAEA